MTVVKEFELDSPSTKRLKEQLEGLGLSSRVLLVDVKPSRELVLSARNLPTVEVRSVAALHTYEVLAAKHLVLSEEAATQLEQRLSS
jgi:ribosomal protein L4